MKPFAEKIFLIEIISQIKGARRALDQLRKSISDEDIQDICGSQTIEPALMQLEASFP